MQSFVSELFCYYLVNINTQKIFGRARMFGKLLHSASLKDLIIGRFIKLH